MVTKNASHTFIAINSYILFYNILRDFDAAETVKDKVNKLFDVKGVKGLSKLMKEIAQTASTGKHDNELIGRATINLKVDGQLIYCNMHTYTQTD